MCSACSTIPLFARAMIPTIAPRVETQQSGSLAALSQFIGFRLIAPEYWQPRREWKSRIARCESDRRTNLIRWASGKISALPIRGTLISLRVRRPTLARARRRSSRSADRRAEVPSTDADVNDHNSNDRGCVPRRLTVPRRDPSRRSTHK